MRKIFCMKKLRFLWLFLALSFVLPLNAAEPVVYQIPIEKQIEPALLYVIRRGVDEAAQAEAAAVIFVMDTPGGRVDVTRDIIDLIRQIEVPVYTFVKRDAYSAGAIIALATPHIYMAPGSVIGAATPLIMSPTGGIQETSEDVGEKMKSGVAAMVRAAAEQGGHDPQLAEAMVRRETEYKVGTNVISKAGELLTLTDSEAEGILSEGTVADVEALLEKIGLPDAEIRILEVTPAEQIARVIAAIAPLLLMAGLAGIWLELKTPGIGLPGLAGAICLILFFFGHHIAGLAGMEDIALFIFGFLLLAVEIFITPGFGVLGTAGILLVFLSLLNAMSWEMPGEVLPSFSPDNRTLHAAVGKLAISLLGTILLAVLAGKYLPKTKLARPLILQKRTDRASGYTAAHEHAELVGQEGIAENNLHPSGRILLGNERFNVITAGEFIDQGVPVRIAEVHGSRIIVEKA